MDAVYDSTLKQLSERLPFEQEIQTHHQQYSRINHFFCSLFPACIYVTSHFSWFYTETNPETIVEFLASWKRYWNFEQRHASDPQSVITLYERALLMVPNSFDIWDAYLIYLVRHFCKDRKTMIVFPFFFFLIVGKSSTKCQRCQLERIWTVCS
jgi:hypothetical protein